MSQGRLAWPWGLGQLENLVIGRLDRFRLERPVLEKALVSPMDARTGGRPLASLGLLCSTRQVGDSQVSSRNRVCL